MNFVQLKKPKTVGKNDQIQCKPSKMVNPPYLFLVMSPFRSIYLLWFYEGAS